EVAVPNVVGLSSEEAITALTDIGLVADITETRADNEIAEGYVISQDYLEGEMLKEGFTVKLVISSGSIESLIPNVKQQTLAKARVMIENEGFDVGNIAYEFNDLPEGMVISQSPKSGIKMPENTIVDLVVSKGPEIKTYIVPSVIGKTVREAEATLNQIGLKLGSISYELSDEYEQGQVISQEFLGQEVKQGTEIPVVISNGPETESTEATTEDTSVSGEGEIRLTVSIDTTKFTSETETVRIDMVQDNLTTIVYQGEHSKSEGDEITIEQVVRGSGSATIYVYYGDVLQTEREITF
ncbi:MAG: eukaryotic-like serine/threonine-protein kinase, partial [Clostridiales bacterium]|nr:eukaryotic-like serine/threonine-protein kinase [Clostridiales bacterium]